MLLIRTSNKRQAAPEKQRQIKGAKPPSERGAPLPKGKGDNEV